MKIAGKKKRYGAGLSIKPGAPPATLQAGPDYAATAITALAYGPEKLIERQVNDLEELDRLGAEYPVLWVQVSGLGNVDLIKAVGEKFQIHPLALEDLMSGGHRPKLEETGSLLFIILQSVHLKDNEMTSGQIALLFRQGVVLSFHQDRAELLDPLRERIRRASGRIRNRGSDYLAYAIMDSVVDHYFPVLESIGDLLEDIEDEVVAEPDQQVVAEINETKRVLLQLRRSLWPVREVAAGLMDHAGNLIQEETRPFIRDCQDHVIQAVDLITSHREIAAAMSDLYLSALSNRMNEIMKVLTIIATIFIPLTFIAGVYGMNFNPEISAWNMPELRWRYGYPAVWLVMLAAGLVLFIFFKKKKWL